jgi:hypothetical protein
MHAREEKARFESEKVGFFYSSLTNIAKKRSELALRENDRQWLTPVFNRSRLFDGGRHFGRNTRAATFEGEMRAGGRSNLEFLMISMKTDANIEGHSFGFAGRGAEMAGTIAASALKPFFQVKDPLFRERLWQEFRVYGFAPRQKVGTRQFSCPREKTTSTSTSLKGSA